MRESEERRPRQFVVGERKDYDEPTVRRRAGGSYAKDREEIRGEDEEERRQFRSAPARKSSLRDRESEEPESRSSYSRRMKDTEYLEDEEEYETDRGRKAPLLVRVFAWCALLAIFFACGYLGANYFFKWADKRGGPRVGDVVASSTEVAQMPKTEGTASPLNASYSLYVPEDGTFKERAIDIKKGLPEEDMEKVISMYIDGLKEINMMGSGVRAQNIFRSGETLYLDMTSDFQKSVKSMGKDKASLALSGLLKTMNSNFSPINRIKFYIDGKELKDTTPVDLTKPWENKG